MKLILPLSEITEVDEDAVGGKAFALSRMTENWRHVPDAMCVTGVPEATTMIHTGGSVRIDGYLGIVTVRRSAGSVHQRT